MSELMLKSVHDLLGKNYFIPFQEEFIVDVTDKIYIEEIEGLFNED